MIPEARYRRLVETVTDYGIFMLDREGRITTWNAGARNIEGYEADEIIGRHFSCFYPPEAVKSGWPQQELRMAAENGRLEDEGWRLRKDGTRFWASVIITALRDDRGALIGYSKITRDLTERRKRDEILRLSEERFRLLVEAVQDYAVYMLDPGGNVSSWNAGAERMKGYAAAEIIGRHFSLFYLPDDVTRGKPAADLRQALAHGSAREESWRVRKDGSRFWADSHVSIIRDPQGMLRGYAMITRDLTERKQVEALEESRRRTQEFLAMLSHELRNPLAPLRTAVEVMRNRSVSDDGLQEIRRIIESQVSHMTRLVDELLDVSRITTGRIALACENVDVAAVVERSVEACRSLIEQSGQSLKLALPGKPVWVMGDSLRLTQSLINLLNNAAQYTPVGGTIELSVGAESDGAEIRVRDDGNGISPELLPRIFDLFTQGARSLDRAEGGLGVGLALVRKIVEMHGGTVRAHSDGPGHGAEFVIVLPRRGAPANPLRTEPKQTEAPDCGTARRILIVDDNHDAAESLSMLLQIWGHQVQCAYDGPSALATAAEFRPEVVLLDIGLPGMSGYEVAERLRQNASGEALLLVAITGYGQDADRSRSRAAGFDHHFVKPVAPETLRELLA